MEKKSEIIKVPFGIVPTLISLVVMIALFFIGRVRDIDSFIALMNKGGYVIIVIIILYYQFFTSTWILYNDRLVVKRPLRPFYNRFEFPLKDITKIKYNNALIGRVNPYISIRCTGSKIKNYGFGFSGNMSKMDQLINILIDKGVHVEKQSEG